MNDLYLSRVSFAIVENGGRPERGVTQPYILHQLVSDLFGEHEERPFLYRTEDRHGTTLPALVLSRRPPESIDRIPGRRVGTVRSVETKLFDVDVPVGTRLDFEIRLNATKDEKQKNGGTRRIDVWEAVWRADRTTDRTQADVYGEYIARKMENAALLDSVHVVGRGFVRAQSGMKKPAITFVATDLIGSLVVTDSARLRVMVSQGLGRSKAFGCGLLCLSRPGSILPRRYPDRLRQPHA